MESMGADSIAIKDMSGLLLPEDAGELVKALKSTVKVPIQLHTHCTTGIAMLSYMKAIEAGVDIVDTAISPFAEGSSQPATEVLAKVLEGTARDPDLIRKCWLRSPTISSRSETDFCQKEYWILK